MLYLDHSATTDFSFIIYTIGALFEALVIMRRKVGSPLAFWNILFCDYKAIVCYRWKSKIFSMVWYQYEVSLIHIQIKVQHYLERLWEYRNNQ